MQRALHSTEVGLWKWRQGFGGGEVGLPIEGRTGHVLVAGRELGFSPVKVREHAEIIAFYKGACAEGGQQDWACACGNRGTSS